MYFLHDEAIWQQFPALTAALLRVDGIDHATADEAVIAGYVRQAEARLGASTEGAWPEIAAWREAFSSMGLKPTRYRSAPEALLRRLRTKGDLPRVHPFVDLCNALSVAYAVPIAVYDVARVDAGIVVRHAVGSEIYQPFGDAPPESPEPGEVVFADESGHAHARRWTFRQSARSTVSGVTERVLVVIEALHAEAVSVVPTVAERLAEHASALGLVVRERVALSAASPRFDSAED